jgi:hypothetical protein
LDGGALTAQHSHPWTTAATLYISSCDDRRGDADDDDDDAEDDDDAGMVLPMIISSL